MLISNLYNFFCEMPIYIALYFLFISLTQDSFAFYDAHQSFVD